MTDKEKAKAYDEALDRMKYVVVVPKDEKALQALKETIFPELAESEDERIRRTLVEYFGPMAQLDLVRGVPIQKIRDWLEKQKEPHYTKRNALFDKCVANCDPAIMKQVSDEVDEKLKEQNPAEYLDLDNASQDYVYNHFCQGADFTPDYIKGLMEDAFIDGANWQKEQKPAEWSKEDERMLSRCVKSIESSKQFADADTFKKAKDKEIEWLKDKFKSLPERFNLQPKQEWSEEDEKLLDFWLDVIDRNDWRMDENFCKASREFINKLKSHHPQPKQEWSEEDEKNLELVIDCIYKFYPDPVMKYKLKEWLKSLRPSKDCSSCAKHLEGYISGRSDAENKLLEQFGALITPEGELHIKPRWKPSEDEERLINTSISFLKDFADKGYENAVECIDWLKSKLNGNTCK